MSLIPIDLFKSDPFFANPLSMDKLFRPFQSQMNQLNNLNSLAPSLFQTQMNQLGNLSNMAPDLVRNDKNEFHVNVDCSHFKPEELKIKVVDDNLIIQAKHEEKADEHGYIMREFTRRYKLPKGADPGDVKSSLDPHGYLSISAPKKSAENERVIPIALHGSHSVSIQNGGK